MSAQKWTNEQLEAITQRGCNLLVAAAAGAGKTAVLVERIIRKITDKENPIDIDSLLVVTFTNAAAAEMRERVGLAIEKALEEDPQSQHLQRQLALLDKASITTMHSFCLNVVKGNFHIIELDPAFRIADETEAALMKYDILEELFEEKYENSDTGTDFYRLVESYGGGKNDQGLQEMVLSLYEFIQSHPWPEKWLEEHTQELMLSPDADICETTWGKVIFKSVASELDGLVLILEDALISARLANGLEPYVSCLENDIDLIIGLQSVMSSADSGLPRWDNVYTAFSDINFLRLTRCGKDADPEAQEIVKAARKEVKDRIAKIHENIFITSSEGILEDLAALYPLLKELSGLVIEFGERFSQRKREKTLLDFNDLEHLCLKILVNDYKKTDIATGLSEKYEEILVDEYQDSNLIQEVIINAISKEEEGHPNIFMVGDVKQSIYRFRQARPELFLSKYNTYASNPGMPNMRILLYKNFRSRPEIIYGVNFIFKQIMSLYVGELNYTDEEALNPGAVFAEPSDTSLPVGGPVEVDIIDLSGNMNISTMNEGNPDASEDMESLQESEDESEQLDAIQIEARHVAGRIRTLIDNNKGPGFQVYDNKLQAYRKAEYKDIVILLRTTRNWADVFLEELGAQGIPAFADAGNGYFKTVEIQTIISLLQIIDNPLQDIPLLAVLRSPVYSFSSDELAEIRLLDRSISFIEAVRKYSVENNTTLYGKCEKFLKDLENYRLKAQYLSTDELIWYLYTDTSYYSYVGILPGGRQRQANLRMLFDRARQYEETSYKGLFNFVNFMDRLKSNGGDFGSAKILGENENVVRIMSIHKSKGLEFPIVFVSGCGKKFNLQDMNNKILVHQDLGFGPDLVDIERRITYPVVTKQAIKYKIRLETLSEEMRILYVAFTRAREKLIITGTSKDFQKAAVNWTKSAGKSRDKLPEFDMLKAARYLDWICPALARHKDGKAIRQSDINTIESSDSYWKINIISNGGKGNENSTGIKSIADIKAWLSVSNTEFNGDKEFEENKAFEEVSRRLDWKYLYGQASEIPSKISVTELKRRFNMENSEEQPSYDLHLPSFVTKPAFMDTAKGFSSAEKGTIMHFVMQHFELDSIRRAMQDTPESKHIAIEIRRQMNTMIDEEFITAQECEIVDVDRISSFFNTKLGDELLNANKVNREVPFNIELKLVEIYKNLPHDLYGDETILLQGVIDCFLEVDGGLVLLDYKTDFVPITGSDPIKERYKIQMEYYTKALEAITGKKVITRYLYLFYNGEIIVM